MSNMLKSILGSFYDQVSKKTLGLEGEFRKSVFTGPHKLTEGQFPGKLFLFHY
jgi:hypothetical protein